MNSVLLCEGSTDYTLLQYYMRNAHQWEDDRERQSEIFRLNGQSSRKLFNGEHILTIASVGGCSSLIEGLQQTLNRNKLVFAKWEKYRNLQEDSKLLADLSG